MRHSEQQPMKFDPAQAADVAALIARWQREANNFRTVAAEMFEHGDNEEGTLCDVEASRIDTCASELRALAPPHPPAGNAVVEALEQLIAAARQMPRQTPAPGGAATMHSFLLSAGVVWDLDRAIDKAVTALQAREAESRSAATLLHALQDIAAKRGDVFADPNDVYVIAETAIALHSSLQAREAESGTAVKASALALQVDAALSLVPQSEDGVDLAAADMLFLAPEISNLLREIAGLPRGSK